MIVNLADMKAYLGVAPTDTQWDTFLQMQLNVVESAVENYCRRKFEAADYRQTYPKNEYDYQSPVELMFYPVSAITTFKLGDQDLTQYRLSKKYGTISRSYEDPPFFGCEDTVVEYTAGYDYADIPADVKNVVYCLVEERFNKKKAGIDLNFGSDVQRISIPGAISIDFDYTLSNNDRKSAFGVILGNHVNILDFWRSERAVLGPAKIEYVEEL